jgi:hypothetical protein
MCPHEVIYDVFSGWVGGLDDGSNSGEANLSDAEVLESIPGTVAVVREVKAFTGSERFRGKDAFSAQIAHWSRGRDQYFPRLRCTPPSPCSLVVLEAPSIDFAMEGMLVGTLIWDVRRESRRRKDRALRSGRRKRRNSWQDLISDGKLKVINKLTVNACHTICRFMNS